MENNNSKIIRIFVEYDPVFDEQFKVCVFSLISNCSKPIDIYKISASRLNELGISANQASKWYIPFLENYRGYSLFLSKNLVINCDISDLLDLIDSRYSIFRTSSEFNDVIAFQNKSKYVKQLTPDFLNAANEVAINSLFPAKHIKFIPDKFNFMAVNGLSNDEPQIVNYRDCGPDNQYNYIYNNYLEQMNELEECGTEPVTFEFEELIKPRTIMDKFWSLFGYKKYKTINKILHLEVYETKIERILRSVKNAEKQVIPDCDWCKKKKRG